MRYLAIAFMMMCFATFAQAQTPPSNSEEIYATLTGGQVTRFDYAANADDVHIANLLTALLVSIWSMFFFVLFVVFVRGLKA